MRALLGTASVCMLLSLPAVGGAAAPPTAAPTNAAPTNAAPTKVAPPTTAPASADSEAAAKHAKRTACIKSARAKKLVDAQKTAFMKECVAAP